MELTFHFVSRDSNEMESKFQLFSNGVLPLL